LVLPQAASAEARASPRVVNAFNAGQAILKDTYAHYQGQLAERGAYFAAKTSRWQGKQAMMAGLIGAGSTVLTAALNYSGMKAANTGGKGPPLTSGGTVR
jgi:hypothetical protein